MVPHPCDVQTHPAEALEAERLLRLQLDLALRLGASSDLGECFAAILDAVMLVPGVDAGGIYRIEPGSGDLVLAVHRRLDLASAGALRRRAGETSLAAGPRPLASLPMRDGERMLAVLDVASHGEELSPSAHAALASITSRVGAVLARVQAGEAGPEQGPESAALTRAGRAEDAFLAGMSHELRTPLNGILGVADALQDGVYGPPTERQREALGRIDASGRHLLALIGDLLDLAKMGAGLLRLTPGPVLVSQLLQDCLRTIQDTARRKGHRVSVSQIGCVSPLLLDERRVKQVVGNLLANAVKFTPEGGALGILAEECDEEVIRFEVWDTGIGIAEEEAGRIFDRFVQLDGRLARRHPGAGLGLTLVRRIVDLHGGAITLQSEPGRGSRFSVSLPLALADARPPRREPLPAEAPAPLLPAEILVAEDDEGGRALLRDILEQSGFTVRLARDGAEVVAMAHEQVPDVLLMDVQMPGVDGLTATRELRRDLRPDVAAVPIIAVTALAMPGDRERCLEAGMTDYVTKPLARKRLLAAIDRQLRQRPS